MLLKEIPLNIPHSINPRLSIGNRIGLQKQTPRQKSLPPIPDDVVVVEITKDSHDKLPLQNQIPASSPSVGQNANGLTIQDAFKRATTLSANDDTQICIDITGDDDNLIQGDAAKSTSGREIQAQLSQPQFASLAPFTQVSRKWFHALDSTVIDVLASKAQDIAINCCHISGMNSALYLLSKGPWVPTHVSVHVRQAALAAVGAGWSWVNQVSTAFPFTCYEACLSLATLDKIPSNLMMPNDAIYELYSTICANLCQPTRNFLFSKIETHCQTCNKVSTSRIDTFVMTLGKDTEAAAISELLVPWRNKQDIEENKACPCVDTENAQWHCSKLGPLVVVRMLTPEGVSLPKIEEERFPIGHTLGGSRTIY